MIPPIRRAKYAIAIGLLTMSFTLPLILLGCSEKASESANTTESVYTTPFAAVARGRVDVEGGLIKLAASRDGLVTEVSVKEGDYVKKGDCLALLDERPVRLSRDLAQQELAQANALIDATRIKLQAAEREDKRLGSLLAQGIIPRMQSDQARDQVQILKAELRQASEAKAASQTRLQIQEQELEQRRIRAPKDGQVVRCLVRPGDGVSTLSVTPLFLFAPDAARIVRAELEERFVAAVSVGQPVEISPDYDTALIIKGCVTRIGQVLNPKGPTDDPAQRSDVSVAECMVSLENQSLLIGQRVLVRILRSPVAQSTSDNRMKTTKVLPISENIACTSPTDASEASPVGL